MSLAPDQGRVSICTHEAFSPGGLKPGVPSGRIPHAGNLQRERHNQPTARPEAALYRGGVLPRGSVTPRGAVITVNGDWSGSEWSMLACPSLATGRGRTSPGGSPCISSSSFLAPAVLPPRSPLKLLAYRIEHCALHKALIL